MTVLPVEPTHAAWRTDASTVEALADADARPIRVRGVPLLRGQRVEVLALTVEEAAELELQLLSARTWLSRREAAPLCICGHGPAWHSTPQPSRTCLATGCNCTH